MADSSWNWEVNLGGLNGMLNAMLSRYQNMADINIAEAESSRPRNARAFEEWLQKREFDREMTEWEAKNRMSRQSEDDRRWNIEQERAGQPQRDAERNCAAARAKGIPCAAPGGGLTYGGSSQGGVPAARTSPSVYTPVETPAWGPRTGSGGGGGSTTVNAGGRTTVVAGGGGGGGAASFNTGFRMPDYWDTNAQGGGQDMQCKDASGNWGPCD